MSAKARDNYNRWRSKTVAFRMSEGEAEVLDNMVALSGMTKQDYITHKLLNREVVVKGNPRVFKSLKGLLEKTNAELERLSGETVPSVDLMETIKIVSTTLGKMTTKESEVEENKLTNP